MADWVTIIGGAAAGLGATGIAAASGLLVNVALKVSSIETKLDLHVSQEDDKEVELHNRLTGIERKLPNGEVEETFQMVRELHGYFEDEIREWKLGAQGAAAVIENTRKDERVHRND